MRILLLSLALWASLAMAPETVVMLDGQITPESAEEVVKNLKEIGIVKGVTILINSEGGDVDGGLKIMNEMTRLRQAGTKVTCMIVGLAASMAFNILPACSERIASQNAQLMFHPVRTTVLGLMSAKDLERQYLIVKALDERFIKIIHESSSMPLDILRKAYYDEKMWKAWELALVTDNWIQLK